MDTRNRLCTLAALSLLSVNLFTSAAAPLRSKASTAAGSQEQVMTKSKDDTTKESPFVCNMAGLNKEQRQRYTALIKKLDSGKQEVRELPDGYALRFSSEASTVQDLAEFIVYERLCCPFFDFELIVEREGGPVWLRLKGREGVKEFIRLEFGIK